MAARKRKARIVKTVAELADELGVHKRTAERWQTQGCPRTKKGHFDLDQVNRWRHDYRSRAADRSAKRDPDTGLPLAPDPLKEAKTERERLRSEREQIELARMRGETVPRADVSRMLVARATAMRRALRSLGRRFGRRFANIESPRQIQRELEAEIDRILMQAYGRPPDELKPPDRNGRG